MNKEQGYTLTETLLAVALLVILSATGSYGWRAWQQQQRLLQSVYQVRDFLLWLRADANAYRRSRTLRLQQTASAWCLVATFREVEGCPADVFVLRPGWPEVAVTDITPTLGFYGLRNTAWPGHIQLQSPAGSWSVIVSSWGRVRICEKAGDKTCP